MIGDLVQNVVPVASSESLNVRSLMVRTHFPRLSSALCVLWVNCPNESDYFVCVARPQQLGKSYFRRTFLSGSDNQKVT